MSNFQTIISDLRKGCGSPTSYWITGYTAKCGEKTTKGSIAYCPKCKYKLDQTLLCEKIANEEKPITNIMLDNEVERLKQKHKDFVIRVLNRIIGKIEDSRNNGGMIVDYCKGIKAKLESEETT